jgi:hypothetical protein
LVALDTPAPAARVALVLQDMFGVLFEEIAPIVGGASGRSRNTLRVVGSDKARRSIRSAGRLRE